MNQMREMVFTVYSPFGGFGNGALGFQQAEVAFERIGIRARWQLLGGFDIDPVACKVFEYLTGVPELCADVRKLTPADLVRNAGPRRPDCIITSAPCVGASGLLSAAKAATEKYQLLNDLSLVMARLIVRAWDEPPPLLLFENVPRLTARAPEMLAELRRILKRAGYALEDSYHDCGELGGLAQKRRRWLLIARHKRQCAQLLYKPLKKRVRGCGEVLEKLPMPGTPAARGWGRMHELPKLSYLNWVRLALIPKGGDWRDLEGVLAEGQPRRELHKRHAVEDWEEPVGTVGGSGSNGVANVADPRVQWHSNVLGVLDWVDPSGVVTGAAAPSRGAFTVADPRITCAPRAGAYGVQDWTEPSKTVTGALQVDNGPGAVADPRPSIALPAANNPKAHHNKYRVLDFEQPAGAVIGASRVGSGAPSVADPRVQVKRAFDAGYAVLSWDEAARTIAGISSVGCGAYSVADPRIDEAPADGGVWTGDPRKAPPFVPVIIAKDGTWHRPLTTLELALLQGFPMTVDGKPLAFPSTSHVAMRKGIGNAIPAPTARAIAEQMLMTLAYSAVGHFELSSNEVWVAPEAEAVRHG